MSLVVMRFLTLGSTPSISNQSPKIISTGNAFLTSGKKISEFSQLLRFFSFFFFAVFCSGRCVYVCVCSSVLVMLLRRWFRHYKMAHETLEDYFLNAVEVRGALAGDLFSQSALYCYSTKKGSHKRLMMGGGGGGVAGGGGGVERAGSDEPQPKRKTHSFSSAG